MAVCKLKCDLYLGYDFAINYRTKNKIKSCTINSVLEISFIIFPHNPITQAVSALQHEDFNFFQLVFSKPRGEV